MSETFEDARIFPSGSPFGILIYTYYNFFIILYPRHFGHILVGRFPHPIQSGQVAYRTTFLPHPLKVYCAKKPFPLHFGQLCKDLALSAAVPLH